MISVVFPGQGSQKVGMDLICIKDLNTAKIFLKQQMKY